MKVLRELALAEDDAGNVVQCEVYLISSLRQSQKCIVFEMPSNLTVSRVVFRVNAMLKDL
jgi:hypothetical protein